MGRCGRKSENEKTKPMGKPARPIGKRRNGLPPMAWKTKMPAKKQRDADLRPQQLGTQKSDPVKKTHALFHVGEKKGPRTNKENASP